MDLAYYESPPGIQLLHCLEFPPTVKGGDSTFYDTFVLAEMLREHEPAAFATLVRVCATFQKSHAERNYPAQMFYTRPHIVTDTGCAAGAITAVFWSPPFEGPLCVEPEDVTAYYAAYDAFAALIKDEAVMAQHMVSLRLEPGDTVTFNQRRLLHVRGAIVHRSCARVHWSMNRVYPTDH
jgi:alpha-ketoglutarate-dependent taurine dioxygenase